MSTTIVFLVAAAGTFVLRASMLVGLRNRSLPPALQSRLALVGPAAIAALCAASLVPNDGEPIAWSQALAAAAAFLVVRRTRVLVHALLVGLPVLWLTQAVGLP